MDVTNGSFLEHEFGNERFDIVILLGTFSNLNEPLKCLEKIKMLLKKDGLIFFNYPNSVGFLPRIYGQHHWMFTPSVSGFYSTKAVLVALINLRFKIVRNSIDYQAPSIKKLLLHMRLGALINFFNFLGIKKVPMNIPVLGVKLIVGRK